MDEKTFQTAYGLIAELFLHPEHRNAARVAELTGQLDEVESALARPIRAFLDNERASSRSEYVQTLELSPPCPLYMGSYLFEEPNTCRGAGMSGRNRYMIELRNIYRHFGMEMVGGEMPDYLPLAIEFLWISRQQQRRQRDDIGLRRHFVENFVSPALEPLHEKLSKFESVYTHLVEALGQAVEWDLMEMADVTCWTPPPDLPLPPRPRGCPLVEHEFSKTSVAEQEVQA